MLSKPVGVVAFLLSAGLLIQASGSGSTDKAQAQQHRSSTRSSEIRQLQQALAAQQQQIRQQQKVLEQNALLDTMVKTPWARFPFHMVLDYEQNTRAATRNRHGYWAEAALGDTKEKGDISSATRLAASNRMP